MIGTTVDWKNPGSIKSLANGNKNEIERMKPDTPHAATDYYRHDDPKIVDEKRAFDRNSAGYAASFIVGAVGVAGFGITFLF
jgi:hypothetical protein